MEDKIFKTTADTLSFDYLKDGTINPVSCFRIVQAVGEKWGLDRGFYVRDLMEGGRVLMLADSVCEFGSISHYEGFVNTEFWRNKRTGRLVPNSVRARNSKGGLIFSMMNYYIVVDLKLRKAMHPEDLVGDQPDDGIDKLAVSNPDYKFLIDAPLIEVEKRTVRRNETDVLGHVNNISYAVYATDILSGDDFSRGISRMVVRYLSELRKDEMITILRGDKDKNIYVTGLNGSGKTSFEVLFEMKK